MSGEAALLKMRILWYRMLQTNQHIKSREVCVRKAVDVLGDGCGRLMFGQQWSRTVKELSQTFNHRLGVIAECFAKQCNAIAVQRLRRASQILALYRRLYGEITLIRVFDRLRRSLLRDYKSKPMYFLFGASIFAWEKEKITDEELKSCEDEMVQVHNLVHHAKTSPAQVLPGKWEKIIDRDHLKVWRRPVENSYLYQYRVYGTFSDIPARAFYNTQVDVDFWKQWDRLAIDIKVVDKDPEAQSEVVHWVMKYPYPMYSRDYVYIRRYKIDHEKKMMVIKGRAVDHPSCPVSDTFVRVSTYRSQMVIRPHEGFDENGFDYVLTYFDDPQSAFPTVAYNWMASTGVPEFVEKLHKAAKLMQERTGGRSSSHLDRNQNNYPTVTQSHSHYC